VCGESDDSEQKNDSKWFPFRTIFSFWDQFSDCKRQTLDTAVYRWAATPPTLFSPAHCADSYSTPLSRVRHAITFFQPRCLRLSALRLKITLTYSRAYGILFIVGYQLVHVGSNALNGSRFTP
jgi:hypothetical protein